MGQVLPWERPTTEAVRRAIQHSQESLRGLAKHYGVNPKTIAKWKRGPPFPTCRPDPSRPDRRSSQPRKRRSSSPSEGIRCCRSTTAFTPCSRRSRI